MKESDHPAPEVQQALLEVIERLEVFVGICDVELKPLYVNDAGRRMCGMTEADTVPSTILEFFLPEDRDFILKEFLPAVERSGHAEVDIRFVHHATNQPFWVSYNVGIVKEGERVVGYATISQNIDARKEKEDSLLRQSLDLSIRESRLRLANTAAEIGTFDLNLLDNSLVWSENLYRMTGVSPEEELTFELFQRLIHPDDLARVQQNVVKAIESGGEYNCEFRMFRPDGTVRWCAARGQVSYDDKGLPVRFVGVDVDITRLKQTEQKLRESTDRITEIADAMPTIVYVCGTDGFCSYVNRRWFEYTGTSAQSALSDSWRESLHPDDRERVWKLWLQSVQSGAEFRTEYRIRIADGSYHWNLARAIPIRDANGVILRWIGTCNDVHEFKLAEEERRRLEEDLRFVFDAVPQIIWTTNATGMAETFNRAWVEYTGRTAEKSLGLQWSSVIHPLDLPQLESTWRRSLQTGAAYTHEARYRRFDGSYRRFLIRAQALKDEHGNVVRWFGSSTDVEDQRRQEELILQSERLTTAIKLASSLAHEINNPLAAVVNALYLINEEKALDDRTRAYVNLASEELVRVSHIVRQNLAFYKERQNLLTVRVRSVVDEVLESLSKVIDLRRIRITKEFDSNDFIAGVETEIRHLVLNLLLNAIEACPDEHTIRIRTRVLESLGKHRVRLTIANAGTIPDSVRTRLFDPFVSSSREKGKGLGLWVSRGITHKHQGHISIRSSERFGSTIVSVVLPAAEQPHSMSAAQPVSV